MKQEKSATGKGYSEIKRKLFEIIYIYIYIKYVYESLNKNSVEGLEEIIEICGSFSEK